MSRVPLHRLLQPWQQPAFQAALDLIRLFNEVSTTRSCGHYRTRYRLNVVWVKTVATRASLQRTFRGTDIPELQLRRC
jgi:hypothetical protein